jgi:hypothetical protein
MNLKAACKRPCFSPNFDPQKPWSTSKSGLSAVHRSYLLVRSALRNAW